MTRPALRVVFTSTAERHVRTAQEWWTTNRPAAPDALVEELSTALELIAQQPSCGVPIAGTRLAGLRRILLRRVGYFLYYRLAPAERQLDVLAFWHSRRGSPPSL